MGRPSVRNAVLEAGMKMFRKKGFNACSVQDITDAANAQKGSFYNHFETKEALAAEALLLYGKDIVDRGGLSDASAPAPTRIKRHFEALMEYHAKSGDGCLIGKFMAETSDETPEIRDALIKVMGDWGKHLSAAIADGQKEGTIPADIKPIDTAMFLIDAFEGAVLRTRLEKNPRSLKAFMKVIFSIILT